MLLEEVSESVTLNWLSHYLVLIILCWITNHFKYMPWLAFTWGETDQHWTASQTIVIAMIFLWGIFRLKRKWFWQKRRSRKRVGSSNEISFDLHLISLSSGDCPLSEPWDLGKGMLAADSVCAEMTPKFQMGMWYKPTTEKETEGIRSDSHPKYF